MTHDPVILPLDLPDLDQACRMVERLGEAVSWYKIGPVLYLESGRELVAWLKKRDKRIFLDMKFHDIPNTVEHACAAAARLGLDLVTIHLSGGRPMIRAARKGVEGTASRLLGVSVLTSTDEKTLREDMGVGRSPEAHVHALVALGLEAGVHGIVCSPAETAGLRERFGKGWLIVNPGIRDASDPPDDQKRTATAREAMDRGADHLVIGRPILTAPDPVAKVASIRAGLR
ncbi:MAG: orotidine-5'-phosphate decarboxylase [Spirochaetes bacterium]|nr:orotidine-5'-phosphate decarboxylase [Spirochaetota bacterium]